MINKMPIRVLQIAGGFRKDEKGNGLSGGIVAFLHNYCQLVDESQIQFDYLALQNQCFESYRKDFEEKGSKLFCLGIQSNGVRRAFEVVKQLYTFLKHNHYDAVHINIGAFFPVLCCAFAAKHAKVKTIVTHSHSAGIYSKKKRFFANIFKPMLPHYATKLCACSQIAALNIYTKKMVRDGKIQIIKNAVDVDRFRYDPEVRMRIRRELGISDELVIGHVGRFVEVKNHSYLLDMFKELKKQLPEAKLLLVGNGDLLPKMQRRVEEMGAANDVIFAGHQKNVEAYYQAMDVFVLPSIVEGFPISALEAQSAGLLTFLSSNITKEVKVTDDCHYFQLSDGAEKLASVIKSAANNRAKRADTSKIIEKAGYDLKGNLLSFISLYM